MTPEEERAFHADPVRNRRLEARDPASGPFLGPAGTGILGWCDYCGGRFVSTAERDRHLEDCSHEPDVSPPGCRCGPCRHPYAARNGPNASGAWLAIRTTPPQHTQQPRSPACSPSVVRPPPLP